ncbi:hypothetical protein GSI_05653 [Ganoderma sinense ZZ0214-1]|uniref:Uncharacterized protein n=1 Tax=Ganoderma sinense ZZ0214-1 TaxID=1077348 RepID=A0A2G8SFD5_9APHY|nr:hypothetical protein GSI_05653 [Ganoderma sinense ZZ0214-1]
MHLLYHKSSGQERDGRDYDACNLAATKNPATQLQRGAQAYLACEGLINTSGGAFPDTALLEIPKNGIPLDMLVIGKPAMATDASNGFMDPATLGTCVKEAKAKGWNGGVMVWQGGPF